MVLHGSLVIFLETVDIDDYLLFFRLSSNFFDTILSFYLFELFSVYLIHSLSRFHSLNMDALQGLLLKCHTAKQSLSCACCFIGSENKTCPWSKKFMAQWGNGSCSVYKVKFKILASARGSPQMDPFQAKSPYSFAKMILFMLLPFYLPRWMLDLVHLVSLEFLSSAQVIIANR